MIKSDYKVGQLKQWLYDDVYVFMDEQDMKLVDTWLTGKMNEWDDVDFYLRGKLVYVSTDTMQATLQKLFTQDAAFHDLFREYLTLARMYMSDEDVRALDRREFLERMNDVLNVWESMTNVEVS